MSPVDLLLRCANNGRSAASAPSLLRTNTVVPQRTEASDSSRTSACRGPAARSEQPAQLLAHPCPRAASVGFHGTSAELQASGRFINRTAFKVAQVQHLPGSRRQAKESLVQQPSDLRPDHRGIIPRLLALECRGRFSLTGPGLFID